MNEVGKIKEWNNMAKAKKLTRKTATALIRRVLPMVTAKQIEGPIGGGDAVIFRVDTGADGIEISCENDWFTKNGLFLVKLADPYGSCMRMYFDPETLDRRTDWEMHDRDEEEKRGRKEWVQKIGVETAHRLMDQYWEGRE